MEQRYARARPACRCRRLGLGTMTWGRDTDEHEAARPARRVPRRRRHPARHGGRRTATAQPSALIGTLLGDVGRPRRPRDRAPRPASRVRDGERDRRHLPAGACCAPSTRSLRRLGADHVDLWQVHTWCDDVPLEETLSALDARGDQRAGPATSAISNYSGWQTRPGRDLAAGLARPRAAGVDPGRVLAARPRRRGGGVRAAGGARARRPGLVAARPRRADRQVPRRHPGGLPGGLPALRGSSSPTSTAAVGRSSRRWSRPPTGSAGPRSRWRWPGCATGRASSAPIVGARTAAQLKSVLGVEELTLPPAIVAALEDVS